MYMIIYHYYGKYSDLLSHIDALKHSIVYSIFIIFTICMLRWLVPAVSIIYGLLFLLIDLLVIYYFLEDFLKIDFDIDINNKLVQKIWGIFLRICLLIIFVIPTVFLIKGAFNIQNIYNKIAMILAGSIWGLIALVTLFDLGKQFIKVEFEREGIFSYYAFMFVPIVFVVLFVSMFLIMSIGAKNEYNEKEKTYKEVYAKYLGYRANSQEASDNEYELIYFYEVDGEMYIISVLHSEFNNTDYQEDKIILYNPNEPSEYIIKNENNILVGIICMLILVIIIVIIIYKNIKNVINRKSKKSKEMSVRLQ